MTIYNCAECGKEVDSSIQPSTQCSECKKDFCSAAHKLCFSNHMHKHKCKGTHQTILSPGWIVNLRKEKDKT